MFSYAGLALPDNDDAEIVSAWIESNIRPAELFPLAYRYWPGDLTLGPVLEVTAEPARPAIINTLFWPWGASRFSQAHFVVDEGTLTKIRAKVISGGAAVTGRLIMNDLDNSITADMWMLPAWPLSQAIAGAGMYLLTLVDDRYWWWGTPLVLSVTPGTTTWHDLYDAIGTALGISISVDTIASAYGKPVADYSSVYRALPSVLDAIAFSVGQRIIRGSFGAVTAENATTALARVTAQLAAVGPKYAGGAFAQG